MIPNRHQKKKDDFGLSLSTSTDDEQKQKQEKKDKKVKIQLSENDIEIKIEIERRNYQLQEKIGEGGYATVFRIVNNLYNQSFALKVFYHTAENSKYIDSSFQAELNALKTLNHPNIIKLYDNFTTPKFHFLVLKYCPLGSLRDYSSPLSISQFRHTGRVILETILYCHEKGFAHCDIKPANFLIDEHGRIQLADFGLSLITQDGVKSSRFGGSKPFLSPEICRHQPFDPKKADVWSLAVTFYYLTTKQLPWSSNDLNQMQKEIKAGTIKFPNNIDPKIGWMLTSMFVVNHESRPSVKTVLSNEFFTDISIQRFSARGISLIDPKCRLLKLSSNDQHQQSQKSLPACVKMPLIPEDRIPYQKKRFTNLGSHIPNLTFSNT